MASRRRGTYWLRTLVALALVLVVTWIFLGSRNMHQHQISQMIFYALTGGLMLYCLLAGLRATADCLSEEKREGTLGLLFLTDLRGYDVVLGKLAANSLNVFYCVLAVVPVLAIPLLLGGVAGAEFGRIALVLINTLFFSLCAGMLASALFRNGRAAINGAFLLILLVAAGAPALGLGLWWLADWRGDYLPAFLVPSPVFSYFAAVDVYFTRGASTGFYWSVGIVHGVSWVYLGLASWIAPRSWQDRAQSAGKARRIESLRTRLEGAASDRHAFRTRLLNRNAYYWLATRPRSRVLWAWGPLVLAGLAWGWGIYEFREDWFNPGTYAVTGFLLAVAMKAYLGAEAGRRLIEDRKAGAMELLLSTPLSVREILQGQRLALQRQFQWPLLAMLAADFVMLNAGLQDSDVSGDPAMWIGMWLAGVGVFFADVVALYWHGMWTGLAARSPKHAFGAAVVPVLVLPWIAMGATLTAIELLPYEFRRLLRWDGWPLLLWFGFSLLTSGAFGLSARHNLLRNFRVVAAQRYQVRASWWQRWFGRGGASG